MLKRTILVLIFGIANFTIAHASDNIIYSPQPISNQSTGFSWTGGYAGFQVGGGKVNATGDYKASGLVFGAHTGFLWQMNKFVAGAELDVDASNIEVDGVKFNSFVRAKLRGGIAIDKALLSASVGYVRSTVSAELAPGLTLEGSGTGWVAGAGIDYALTDRFVIGGEYLYHQFDQYNSSDIDINVQTARVRLSYKY